MANAASPTLSEQLFLWVSLKKKVKRHSEAKSTRKLIFQLIVPWVKTTTISYVFHGPQVGHDLIFGEL